MNLNKYLLSPIGSVIVCGLLLAGAIVTGSLTAPLAYGVSMYITLVWIGLALDVSASRVCNERMAGMLSDPRVLDALENTAASRRALDVIAKGLEGSN